ncbi:hypothetical protein G7Y79_00013g035940 [Physcia stellaris]|nr:hypothetical protein G7Y79_00013g035940 [Physcia stellaris]
MYTPTLAYAPPPTNLDSSLHTPTQINTPTYTLVERFDARPPAPYQSRITAYFLPATNQKAPISQDLKNPNPKSFQQHTPAKPIRPASALPEKSAFSPYKKPSISYTSLPPSHDLDLRLRLRLRRPFDLRPQITFVAPASIIPASAMARSTTHALANDTPRTAGR